VLSTLIPGLLVLCALAAWHHGRNGQTKGPSMNRAPLNLLGLALLFCAALFFASAGFGFALGTLTATREIALGLLCFVVGALLGLGGWVFKV